MENLNLVNISTYATKILEKYQRAITKELEKRSGSELKAICKFGFKRAFDRRLDRDFNLFPELGFEGFIDFTLKARMLDMNDLFFTGSNRHEVSPVAESLTYT